MTTPCTLAHVLPFSAGTFQGYMSLFWYICFVLIFITILSLQLNVSRAFTVDFALREVVLEQTEKLDGVRTQDQIWTYLIGEAGAEPQDAGLMAKLFQEQWYNGDQMDATEAGYVLDHNKLVGGVLLVQKRGKVQNCTRRSMYAALYPSCYSSELDQEPFGPPDPSANSSEVGGIAGIYKYSDKYKGHGVFLPVSEGRDNNIERVRKLKEDLWLDKSSRDLDVKCFIYNGNLEVFTYLDLRFQFGPGGGLIRPHSVKIQSVQLELYSRPIDMLRLGLELFFVAYVGFQVGTEANEIINGFAEGEPLAYFQDAWNVLDILNISLFSFSIIWRVRYIYLIYSDTLVVPASEYKLLLENAANIQENILTVNSCNILICVFRLFKYYEFQDRLNILTRTFSEAWTDLYHFLIMFIIIFVGYAFLSHVIWGPHVYTYSTFAFAIQAQWEMLLGNYDYQALHKVAPDFAAILFWTYIFFVAIVCLNVLLAILIEAFGSAFEPSDPDIPPNSVGEQLSIFVQRLHWFGGGQAAEKELSDDTLAKVLRHFAADGIKKVSEQDIAARLDYGMQGELQRKLPILKVAGPELDSKGEDDDMSVEERRERCTQAALQEQKLELLARSTRLLRENTRLKEELALWEEELAAQDNHDARTAQTQGALR